jgi:hypothetical protein
MFEFEDEDFTLMESFSLSVNQDGRADSEIMDLPVGTYLGDGVWVVDTQDESEEVGQAQFRLSES